MTSLLAALLALVALSACASAPGSSPTPSEPADPSPSPRASLPLDSEQPTRRPVPGGTDELTGTLGADSVEGGCPYLLAQDGQRYEVIYPEGWSVTAAPLQLTNPDGEVVATGGETITVNGSEAGDMASICMIGPIFNADEVVSIE